MTDLQAYLAAPMDLAVVRTDLRKFEHTHGEIPPPWWLRWRPKNPALHAHTPVPAAFGPALDAYVTFPTTGTYRVFAEISHGGETIVTAGDIEVR